MLPIANIPFTPLHEHPHKVAILNLIQRAEVAWKSAYAPYSKFMVGSAMQSGDGTIFVGCNAETANYNGGHGEQGCITHMVEKSVRNPVRIVSVGALEGQKPVVLGSCGMCRQWLQEYASLNDTNIEFVVTHPKTGEIVVVKMSDYLPWSFGPADIGVDLEKYRG